MEKISVLAINIYLYILFLKIRISYFLVRRKNEQNDYHVTYLDYRSGDVKTNNQNKVNTD